MPHMHAPQTSERKDDYDTCDESVKSSSLSQFSGSVDSMLLSAAAGHTHSVMGASGRPQ